MKEFLSFRIFVYRNQEPGTRSQEKAESRQEKGDGMNDELNLSESKISNIEQ